MGYKLGLCVAAAVIGFGAAATWAGEARIVRPEGQTGPKVYRVHTSPRRQVHLVERAVTNSAAVVSRELAEQPVHEHLVEVRVVHTTIYLDPEKNYIRQNQYRIDEDHHILKALRLHAALSAKPARVIRNEAAGEMTDETATITPVLIIDKKDLPPKQERKEKLPGPIVMAD